MRVRIVIDGKIAGIVPIHWTISEPISNKQRSYALWLQSWLDGSEIRVGSVLRATIRVVVE